MTGALQFAYPWLLLLLWLVPLAAFGWLALQRRQERLLADFIAPDMQEKLRPAAAARTRAVQGILLFAGLFLALLAAARPQWGLKEQTVIQKRRDLLIALDVSRSMLADDVHPNRLARAKADIMDLVRELRGDRAGLVAFRGKASLLCPLTSDYTFLKQSLDGVDIGSAPRGETNIGDALRKCIDAFDEDHGAHRAIILISDGEDLSGTAREMAGVAAEKGIPIFTVGLGARQGSRIPDEEGHGRFFSYRGEAVVTKLDHQTLYDIAEMTGGAYIPVETASLSDTTLGILYRDLRKLSERDMEESLQRRRIDRYPLFLLPGFLMLLAAALLSRGRLARQRRSEVVMAAAAVALLLCVPTALAVAETNTPAPPGPGAAEPAARSSGPMTPRAAARTAQRHYRRGGYDAAARNYLYAASQSTGEARREYLYNAALALRKSGRHADAGDLYRELARYEKYRETETYSGAGEARYRQAMFSTNTMERADLFRQAADNFREAARATDESLEARRNLERVLASLPAAEREARIARLREHYGTTDTFKLAAMMLAAQRQLSRDARQAFTSNTPDSVGRLEDAAAKQHDTADLWIPLKEKLLSMILDADPTNAQQRVAESAGFIDQVHSNMLLSASALRDLNPEGVAYADSATDQVYGLWKGVAPYAPLLKEALRRQTNILDATSGFLSDSTYRFPEDPSRQFTEQDETAALTALFATRFETAVPKEGIPGQPVPPPDGDTNAPPKTAGGLSAEDRARILVLAKNAQEVQHKAAERLDTAARTPDADRRKSLFSDAREHEAKSAEILKEIERLLPKSQQQQSQDQARETQSQEKPPEAEPQRDPNQDPREKQPPPEEKDPSLEQAEKILEQALQREKEHEAEKRRRRKTLPLPPLDRDW